MRGGGPRVLREVVGGGQFISWMRGRLQRLLRFMTFHKNSARWAQKVLVIAILGIRLLGLRKVK